MSHGLPGPGGCWGGFFLLLPTFRGGSLLYLQRTGLLPLLFSEYYVLSTVIFWVCLAGGRMGRGGITHKRSLNKEPVKYRHLAPGFCWLQGRHCKLTNTNCFHVCSHFCGNKMPLWLMENETSICCLFTTLHKSSPYTTPPPNPHPETLKGHLHTACRGSTGAGQRGSERCLHSH